MVSSVPELGTFRSSVCAGCGESIFTDPAMPICIHAKCGAKWMNPNMGAWAASGYTECGHCKEQVPWLRTVEKVTHFGCSVSEQPTQNMMFHTSVCPECGEEGFVPAELFDRPTLRHGSCRYPAGRVKEWPNPYYDPARATAIDRQRSIQAGMRYGTRAAARRTFLR